MKIMILLLIIWTFLTYISTKDNLDYSVPKGKKFDFEKFNKFKQRNSLLIFWKVLTFTAIVIEVIL